MGTVGGGDGGNLPPDGGLPGWGPIVIPDDPAELAEEAARVRSELRREARRRRWLHRLRWLVYIGPSGRPTVRLSTLLLSMAIFATLASLFTLGYAGTQRGGPLRSEDAPTMPTAQPLAVPALDLLDSDGRLVSLRSHLPAVILLTEGCDCDELVATTAATTAAVTPHVTVVVVGRTAPELPTSVVGLGNVRPLADPAGELRSMIGIPPASTRAGVVVAAGNADIIKSLPAVTTVDAFRASLDRLVLTSQRASSSPT
jgi:hypothetical protein